MAEVMLGEPSDVSRVLFPPDFNAAAETMQAVFQSRGQVWTLVVAKADSVPELLSAEEAKRLCAEGAITLDWASDPEPAVVLTAIGGYQLEQTLIAARRCRERGLKVRVVCMLEPGRFREPRTSREAAHLVDQSRVDALYPPSVSPRVFVSHTRPEAMKGTLRPLTSGPETTRALGFIGRGGTLDINGLLFINGCSWAHVVRAAAETTDFTLPDLLSTEEIDAIAGRLSPQGVLWSDTKD